MNYVLVIEYRLIGDRKAVTEYRQHETIESVHEEIARWEKIFKSACDMFDIRTYELTNL